MRRKQEKKNNCWENLQGFRYAHRGLFHQPRSASKKVPEILIAQEVVRQAVSPGKGLEPGKKPESGKKPAAGKRSKLGKGPDPESGKKPAPEKGPEPLWREDISRWKNERKKIVPENSMEAFRMAVRYGFGSELDVHLTKDGRLAVFHDASLFRMTGVNRQIEKMTWGELSKIRLLNTSAAIPLLEEVLDLYTSEKALTKRVDARKAAGKWNPGNTGRSRNTKDTGNPGNTRNGVNMRNAGNIRNSGAARNPAAAKEDRAEEDHGIMLHLPLIIELKAEGNVSGLCRRVMETVDRYPELNYCIESFDPRVVFWLRRHRPDVIRGQLTENFMKSREAVRQWGHLMTFGMWSVAPDILSRPDFISCKFPDRKNLFIRFSHRCGVRQVNWIIRNKEELGMVDREGGLSIFERFLPDRD